RALRPRRELERRAREAQPRPEGDARARHHDRGRSRLGGGRRRGAGSAPPRATLVGHLSLERPFGGSSNGRTSGFGPENRGSNPCPPAERVCRGPVVGEAVASTSGGLAPGARPAPYERIAGGIASLPWPHQSW